MRLSAHFNSLLNLGKAHKSEKTSTSALKKLPPELNAQIAHHVTLDAMSDAQKQHLSREHGEAMAAKALFSLALSDKEWSGHVRYMQDDKPGVGLAMTRNAITSLARRSPEDMTKFQSEVGQLLQQRKYVEVPLTALSEEQRQVMFQALLGSPPARELRLEGLNPSDAPYIPAIAERGQSSLRISINLRDQGLDDQHLTQLAPLFAQPHSRLANIDLRWNNFSAEALAALPEVHAQTTLRTGGDRLPAPTGDIVRSVLRQTASRGQLDLFDHDGLGSRDIQAVVEALKANPGRFTSLCLNHGFSHNVMGPEGSEALAALIKDPDCRLRDLSLPRGGLGDQGTLALALALGSGHGSVNKLNLSDNGITDSGARELLNAIKQPGFTPKTLSLRNNPAISAAMQSDLKAAAEPKGINLHLG